MSRNMLPQAPRALVEKNNGKSVLNGVHHYDFSDSGESKPQTTAVVSTATKTIRTTERIHSNSKPEPNEMDDNLSSDLDAFDKSQQQRRSDTEKLDEYVHKRAFLGWPVCEPHVKPGDGIQTQYANEFVQYLSQIYVKYMEEDLTVEVLVELIADGKKNEDVDIEQFFKLFRVSGDAKEEIVRHCELAVLCAKWKQAFETGNERELRNLNPQVHEKLLSDSVNYVSTLMCLARSVWNDGNDAVKEQLRQQFHTSSTASEMCAVEPISRDSPIFQHESTWVFDQAVFVCRLVASNSPHDQRKDVDKVSILDCIELAQRALKFRESSKDDTPLEGDEELYGSVVQIIGYLCLSVEDAVECCRRGVTYILEEYFPEHVSVGRQVDTDKRVPVSSFGDGKNDHPRVMDKKRSKLQPFSPMCCRDCLKIIYYYCFLPDLITIFLCVDENGTWFEKEMSRRGVRGVCNLNRVVERMDWKCWILHRPWTTHDYLEVLQALMAPQDEEYQETDRDKFIKRLRLPFELDMLTIVMLDLLHGLAEPAAGLLVEYKIERNDEAAFFEELRYCFDAFSRRYENLSSRNSDCFSEDELTIANVMAVTGRGSNVEEMLARYKCVVEDGSLLAKMRCKSYYDNRPLEVYFHSFGSFEEKLDRAKEWTNTASGQEFVSKLVAQDLWRCP